MRRRRVHGCRVAPGARLRPEATVARAGRRVQRDPRHPPLVPQPKGHHQPPLDLDKLRGHLRRLFLPAAAGAGKHPQALRGWTEGRLLGRERPSRRLPSRRDREHVAEAAAGSHPPATAPALEFQVQEFVRGFEFRAKHPVQEKGLAVAPRCQSPAVVRKTERKVARQHLSQRRFRAALTSLGFCVAGEDPHRIKSHETAGGPVRPTRPVTQHRIGSRRRPARGRARGSEQCNPYHRRNRSQPHDAKKHCWTYTHRALKLPAGGKVARSD